MMTAFDAAQALNMRRNGRSWLGDCPACGYKKALTLSEKAGKLLIYCHSCQDSKAIWQVLKNQKQGLCLAKPAKAAEAIPNNLAIEMWAVSLPPQGTPVSEYLKARGYRGLCPDDIRYLPLHKHKPSGHQFPIMITAVRNQTGIVQAIHRTYLQPDGLKKAPIEPAKMSLGPLKGASVHLAKAGPILAISEGIETGLSVMQATGLPVWAALSTSGMIGLELPDVVTEIVLLADHDTPGLKTAKMAATKWTGQGYQVKIICPPKPGTDFNDYFKGDQ
jgi:hypothetical protein